MLMLHLALFSLCSLGALSRRVRNTFSYDLTRDDVRINKCEGKQINFNYNGEPFGWPLIANEYCNGKITLYTISGAPDELANGMYESYGRSGNTNRYERVTANGTTFTLSRVDTIELEALMDEIDSDFTWVLTRGGATIYALRAVLSGRHRAIGAKKPPTGDTEWLRVGVDNAKPIQMGLHKHSFPKRHLGRSFLNLAELTDREVVLESDPMNPKPTPKRAPKSKSCTVNEQGVCDDTTEEVEPKKAVKTPTPSSRPSSTQHLEDDPVLLGMMHPAIGPELGDELSSMYQSANPVPSITLDNIFHNHLLRKALTFKNVPLSEWVGPEEAPYCCKGKYRLNFDKWGTNEYATALQSLLHSPTFIAFLEHMSGISGLEPMLINDNRILWAGSSLIAVERGGFLHVHNDFNTQSDLFRRINVLLYLNEEWKDAWQGHLEMWDTNVTMCLHRILPMFNRMSIFTVLDDAFHGHPEPSAAPRDDVRYALQIVYYTKEFPQPYVSQATHERRMSGLPTRTYPPLHGAVFQAPCPQMSGYVDKSSDLSYICGDDFPSKKNHNQPLCECNFRTVY